MKTPKSLRDNLLKAGAIVLAVVVVFTTVFNSTKNVNADDAGPGAYDTGACKSGNCYSIRRNGAFWVKIPVTANGISASSLGFTKVFKNDTISCWTGDPSDSFVYVLATRLSGGGLAGMVGMDEVSSRGNGVNDGDGKGTDRTGGSIVSESYARQLFQEKASSFWDNFRQKYTGPSTSGTNLAYFCHNPDISSKKKSSSPPDGDGSVRRLACRAIMPWNYQNAKGDTQSRIAVQNMSLDGTYDPTDASGNPVRWKANGSRSGITSDSMWMRNGTQVYTLAKPGDSIRFYHAICMAVRYGQWTPTQGSWVDEQNHTREYTPLPNNWMTIHADPSNYVFEDKGVWNNFARQVSNVSAHRNLFSSAGAGSVVDSTRSAIDIINPTPGNNSYTCNQISWYASRDPFISGGYHIPGFRDGACSSASKTGISQATGTTISQWHEYNALRMWEIRSHKIEKGCKCGVHGARLVDNYSASTVDDAWQGDILGNRKEYYCWDESKTEKDCDYQCDAGYDEYGNCKAAKVPHKIEYHYSDDSFKYMYNSTHDGQGDNQSKWATVYIPYNYQTTVESEIDANDVTFQGAAIATNYKWSVDPRANDKTAPDQPGNKYATSTPDTGRPNETHVVMFEWLYYPGSQKVTGNEFSTQGPQQYYSSGMVPGSYQVIEEVVGDQNPTGNYNGASYGRNHTRTIPDNNEYIGYKYCTAIAFYPSDSHNGPSNNSLDNNKKYREQGAMDAGERWNISGASCRTIAKKPNFQVWNGSIYTEGSINTSVTRKWTNTNMPTTDYNGSVTDLFGSWTDYAIVAAGSNRTMASGAMLGYEDSRFDLAGKGGKAYTATSSQKMNPETIANTSTTTGGSGVYADASYTQNLNRLYSRYRDKVSTLLSEIGRNGYAKQIYATKTGLQAANVGGGETKISQLGVTGGGYPNGTTTTNSGSGLVKRLGNGKDDNTLVIVSTGTVVIDRDICYGDSCGSDATKLRTYAAGTSTKEAAALPQVLIFANNIKITENVTRVDAWLITTGTLNTCADHKIGESSGSRTSLVARDASDRHYTNGNCGLTLVVNGPVFANHIELLRTAGAFHGYANTSGSNVLDRSVGATGGNDDKNKGSVAPAEIFNMRADAYIWAYNQAQRYSEAVVTYTRELAPRY